jgi:hypothetical protein
MQPIESLIATHEHGVVEAGARDCVEETLDGAITVGTDGHRAAVLVLLSGGTTSWATPGSLSIHYVDSLSQYKRTRKRDAIRSQKG